jgi:hypothetical protein
MWNDLKKLENITCIRMWQIFVYRHILWIFGKDFLYVNCDTDFLYRKSVYRQANK